MKINFFSKKSLIISFLMILCGNTMLFAKHYMVASTSSIGLSKADGSILDVSTDLVSSGIAKQNMLPNDKSIDAGPLLQAAVIYAGKHNITTVKVPLGDYYFLSTANNAHVYISNTNNVKIDCNNATFNFSSKNASGIIIRNCNYVGLENVKLDYSLDLPFTTATVASVDVANGVLYISSVLGRPLSDFASSSRYSVRVFVLRKANNGEVKSVPVEWLIAEDGRLSNNSITLKGNPKQLAVNLAKIQPGDLLSVSERSYAGNNALVFTTYPPDIDSGNYAKNVTVYSSPALGVSTMWQNKLSFSNIHIEPKAGRDQYISSNADGINLVNSGNGNTVSDCLVTYTGDDGISFSGNLYATVTSVTGSNAISVNERYKLKANQEIVFVDPDDLHEIGSAIVQQEPQRQRSPSGVTTDVQLDRTFPDLKNGTLIYLPENVRSNGITIQNNTIRYPYSRGIYFSGVNGAQIIGNTIEHTQSSAILGQAERNIPGVTNAVIKNNIINGAFEKGSTGQPGAIEISVESKSTSAFVNKNIVIVNNNITLADPDSKHVGIYMGNTKGYNLLNNTLQQMRANGGFINLNQSRSFVKGASVTQSN